MVKLDEEQRRRVRAAMGYGGLSPAALASEIGTSRSTFNRILAGEREPRAFEDYDVLLERIGAVCGLPPEFFTVDFARLTELRRLEEGVEEFEGLAAQARRRRFGSGGMSAEEATRRTAQGSRRS